MRLSKVCVLLSLSKIRDKIMRPYKVMDYSREPSKVCFYSVLQD